MNFELPIWSDFVQLLGSKGIVSPCRPSQGKVFGPRWSHTKWCRVSLQAFFLGGSLQFMVFVASFSNNKTWWNADSLGVGLMGRSHFDQSWWKNENQEQPTWLCHLWIPKVLCAHALKEAALAQMLHRSIVQCFWWPQDLKSCRSFTVVDSCRCTFQPPMKRQRPFMKHIRTVCCLHPGTCQIFHLQTFK